MLKTKTLSIVIVHLKNPEITSACLSSIKEKVRDLDFEVVLVCNGDQAKKDSETLKKIIPKKTDTIITENKGFGTANNEGAGKASSEYLFLLNPDTVLVENSPKILINFLEEHPEVAAVTPLLCNDLQLTNLQKHIYGNFQSLNGLTLRRWFGKKKSMPEGSFFYADMITAAAMMIKKEAFDEVGGFDERFFMYVEDDDLCMRLKKAGYKNAVLKTTKIVHLEGTSSAGVQKRKMYFKSQDYYWKKHNGRVATALMKMIRFPYKTYQLIKLKLLADNRHR